MSLNYFYKGVSIDNVYKIDASGSTASNFLNLGSVIKFKSKAYDIETQNINSFSSNGTNADSSFCAYYLDIVSTTTGGDNSDSGSSTSGTFTVPSGCTKIKCILIGAGGGSSQSITFEGTTTDAGRGGGGGFIVVQFGVVGGQVINYQVGNAGGLGNNASKNGGTGGLTSINGYIAYGGQYGEGGNVGDSNSGNGGTFTLGSGATVLYSGNGNGVGQNNGYKLFSKGSNLPNETTFSNVNVGQGANSGAVSNSGFIRVYFIYN
jgi:hypothetical protein